MNNHFTLKKWDLNDVAALAESANNINIWRNVTDAFPYPYTEQDAIDYISSTLGEKPQCNFAIHIKGKAAGGIGIVTSNNIYRISAEIGYWLAEKYWGKGIMPIVIKEMSKYVFKNFDIIKLYAGVFEYNKRSMKVLEKAGFTKEAVLKKGAIKDNKIIDLHYYSLIKT